MDSRALFFAVGSAAGADVTRASAPVRPLLEAVPAGVLYVAADRRIVAANDETARIFGIPESEIVGRSILDFASIIALEEPTAHAYPITAALMTGRTQGPLTISLRRPDGSIVWLVVRVVVARDGDGAIVGAVTTLLDITERKRAEEELRRSEANWRLLAENLPDLVFVLDLDARIESVNRLTARMQAANVVIGKCVHQFLHPDHAPIWKAQFACAVETRKPVRFEMRGPGEHSDSWWEQTLIPIVHDDASAIEHVLCVARDVTERRLMTARLAEKERLASIGMLSASVAHEILNPLTYVLASLDFALSDRCPPGARRTKAILDAREGAARMQQIVHDLRALGRANAEDLFYVDVRSVLEMALRFAGSEISRNVELKIDLPELPGVVASESRLCQVFINVILNAVQAMVDIAPEERKIVVGARHDEQTNLVGVHVSDTGPGIGPDAMNRIFDPFFTTKERGTGLGLSISRDFVEKMGGRIEVTSDPGRGATFTIWLSTTRGQPSRTELKAR